MECIASSKVYIPQRCSQVFNHRGVLLLLGGAVRMGMYHRVTFHDLNIFDAVTECDDCESFSIPLV
jgi:hypothetical protein